MTTRTRVFEMTPASPLLQQSGQQSGQQQIETREQPQFPSPAESPVPSLVQPRVVGPGRRERAYVERLSALESARAAAQVGVEGLRRELELSERIERGAQKLVDRLEAAVAAERELARKAEEAQKRLLLALGAVQRENELLRERLTALESKAPKRLAGPAQRGWKRLFERSRAPRA